MKFEPQNDYIIGVGMDPPNKTAAGLVIASDPKTQKDSDWVEVTAVAPNCAHMVGVGDKLIVDFRQATFVNVLGKQYLSFHQGAVITRLIVEPGDELVTPRDLASEVIVVGDA